MRGSDRSRVWWVASAIGAVLGLVVAVVGVAGPAAAAPVTYSRQTVIPVAPASDFAGSGGGDGFDVSLTPQAVYNVFHHGADLRVACHLQVDASNCWTDAYKIVQDGDDNNFATSEWSTTFLNQANGHLYVYGVRSSDTARGVVCIDTTLPPAATDLFCGFTPLSGASTAWYFHSPSVGVEIGTRFYAFNARGGVGLVGTDNTLMCFDAATESACPTPNIDVGLPAGTVNAVQSPISAVGNRVYLPLTMSSGNFLGCFDTTTSATCGGSWPVELPGSYGNGAPIPLLDGAGSIIGVCLPNANAWCYSRIGAVVTAPAGLGAAMGNTGFHNSVPHILEDRVYLGSSEGETVRCYDFGAAAACPNFPLAVSGVSTYVYTLKPDPQRPACLWINGHDGEAQIQNLDAFSGEACGAGAVRVLASSIVAPGEECIPVDYTSLQVVDPARNAYDSATVSFRDSNGNTISGADDADVDDTGTVDLSGLTLGGNGLPQFLLEFEGFDGDLGEVTLDLTWTGEALEECGAVVVQEGNPGPTGIPPSNGIPGRNPNSIPSTPAATPTVARPTLTG